MCQKIIIRCTSKSTAEVLDIIARVLSVILRRRRVSEDEIADFTEEIKERRMGQLFEDYDSSYEDGIYDRGVQQGIKEGIKEGLIGLISIICRKLAKGKSVPVIAEELEQDDMGFVSEICRIAEGFAPDYDTGKIYEEYVKRTEKKQIDPQHE